MEGTDGVLGLGTRPRAHINKTNPLPYARTCALVQRDRSTMPISVLVLGIVPVTVQTSNDSYKTKHLSTPGGLPVHITCRQPLTAWQPEALCFSTARLLIAGPRCQTRPIAAKSLIIGRRVDVLVAPRSFAGSAKCCIAYRGTTILASLHGTVLLPPLNSSVRGKVKYMDCTSMWRLRQTKPDAGPAEAQFSHMARTLERSQERKREGLGMWSQRGF